MQYCQNYPPALHPTSHQHLPYERNIWGYEGGGFWVQRGGGGEIGVGGDDIGVCVGTLHVVEDTLIFGGARIPLLRHLGLLLLLLLY